MTRLIPWSLTSRAKRELRQVNVKTMSGKRTPTPKIEERRQNEADGMHSSSELIFYYKKYKTIYNTKCRE
jgi:hypothetical protein